MTDRMGQMTLFLVFHFWSFMRLSTSLESCLSQSILCIWFGSLSSGRLRSKGAFVFLTVLIAWSTPISEKLREMLSPRHLCLSGSCSWVFFFYLLTLPLPCKLHKFCASGTSQLYLYLNSIRCLHAWLDLFEFLLANQKTEMQSISDSVEWQTSCSLAKIIFM